MRWIRRKSREDTRAPAERLWDGVGELFEDDDEDGWHAGPDVGFDGLSGVDVLRVWAYLIGRAKPPDSDDLVHLWSRDHESVVDAPQPTEAAALVARGELGYMMVSLNDVESCGVLLPQLRVELWPDLVSMYWWAGTGGRYVYAASENVPSATPHSATDHGRHPRGQPSRFRVAPTRVHRMAMDWVIIACIVVGALAVAWFFWQIRR